MLTVGLSRASEVVASSLSRFRGESRFLGAGRSLIAVAQLSVLVLTPYDAMFVPVGPNPALSGCGDALGQLSVFCWAPPRTATVLVTGALVAVAVGLLPRITSWLHLYCSVALGTVIDVPDGGDHTAMVATLWIALACMDDRRTWHWQRPTGCGDGSLLVGVAWAGHWGLRLQMAYIYLNSGIAKTAVEAWQEGTATYYVTRMEFFGGSGIVGDLARWMTSTPAVALLSSWGTIALEVGLAVLILAGPRSQRAALVLSSSFHLMIVVVLGLFSFGLAMVGGVMAATAMGLETLHPVRRSAGPDEGQTAPPQQPAEDRRPAAREGTAGAGLMSPAG